MNRKCHYPDCDKNAAGKAVWCGRLHRVAGNRLIKSGKLAEPESTKAWRQRDTYQIRITSPEFSMQKTIMELHYEQLMEQRATRQEQQETNYLLRELLQNGISASSSSNAQPAPRMQPAAPRQGDDEDFDLEVTEAKADANVNAGYNFQIAAAGMVYGNYDGLALEVVEYGLRVGKIPPDAVRYKVDNYPLPDKPLREIADGNPRQMAVNTDLPAPAFEELDLEEFGL